MGQRSGTETIAGIYQAFLQRPTWSQADLARRLEISSPALRKRLYELVHGGFPAEPEADHPHVYWTVPKHWFPGGIVFSGEETQELLRQLARLAKSAARDRLIAKIVSAAPRQTARPAAEVQTSAMSPSEELYLAPIEDSAGRRIALHLHYLSAARGLVEWRHASVQRIVVGPPARFVAMCHRRATLRWFRVDNVLAARLDEAVPWRAVAGEDVDSFVRTSVDGFHSGDRPVRIEFLVKTPAARWVQSNLPAPMEVEVEGDDIRVTSTTAALLPIARFVVGLGAAAKPMTPELAALVQELAKGALASSQPAHEVQTEEVLTQG